MIISTRFGRFALDSIEDASIAPFSIIESHALTCTIPSFNVFLLVCSISLVYGSRTVFSQPNGSFLHLNFTGVVRFSLALLTIPTFSFF